MFKQQLYKTCKFDGEYVAIEAAFKDGDSWMYRIRRINGTKELVHECECTNFVL